MEGHELKVFQDLDNKSFYSRFIIIESDKLIQRIVEFRISRYEVIGSNGLNTFLKHRTKINSYEFKSINLNPSIYKLKSKNLLNHS